MMIVLSEFERDAFTEALNIGMGQAAASLSEMVNDVIRLSVPVLEFLGREEITNQLTHQAKGDISGAAQDFSGPFAGTAMLLFPERQSLELAQLLLGTDTSTDELGDFEQEALTEVANVVLNACLCTLADLCQIEMNSSIPFFVQGNASHVLNFEHKPHSDEDLFISLRIDFSLESQNIDGYVVLIVDVDSVEAFKTNICRGLQNVYPIKQTS